MPSTLVIYNPVAGNGRVKKQWPHVEKALRKADVQFDAVATQSPFEAIKLAQNASKEYARVIGVGGDGTIHEIVNGLLRASCEDQTLPLGIIPLGNGDDFAKMIPPETPIGGQPFNWRIAVQKIAENKTQLFDVGRIMGDHGRPERGNGLHYYMNSLDVGFGAHGAINLLSIPKYLKGFTAYFAAVIKTMVNYPELHIKIQLDDGPTFKQSTTLTAVMNGRCFGNGFWVCPDARADDGYFDLMVAQSVSRFTILRLIPKLMRGTHVNEQVLRMYRAKHVIIESNQPLIIEADGEIPYMGTHHIELEILHKKLQVIV